MSPHSHRGPFLSSPILNVFPQNLHLSPSLHLLPLSPHLVPLSLIPHLCIPFGFLRYFLKRSPSSAVLVISSLISAHPRSSPKPFIGHTFSPSILNNISTYLSLLQLSYYTLLILASKINLFLLLLYDVFLSVHTRQALLSRLHVNS